MKLYQKAVSFEDFKEVLSERQLGLKDEVVTAQDISVDESSGMLVVKRGVGFDEFPLNKTAYTTLGMRLRVPAEYILRCPSDLQAKNMNYWLSRDRSRQFLMRKENGCVRAFLSSKYSRIDHLDVISTLENEMETDSLHVKFEISETRMVAQLIFPETKPVKINDVTQVGINIVNSEIGFSAVEVSGLIFRLRCLNGLITPDVYGSWKRTHRLEIGKISVEMQESIARLKVKLEQMHQMFCLSVNVGVENPLLILDNLFKKFQVTKEESEAVLVAYSSEAEESQFGLINAFTAAGSRENGLSLEARENLQKIGGRLLTYSRNDFEKLAV